MFRKAKINSNFSLGKHRNSSISLKLLPEFTSRIEILGKVEKSDTECIKCNFRNIVATGHFDLTPYTNVNNWFQKMKKEIPNYEKANEAGADIFGIMYKTGMHPGNKLKLKEVFG